MSKPNVEWDQDLPVEGRQRRETFARFGLAVYQAQCVERQIGILIASALNRDFLRTSPEERDSFFDVEFAKTLGQLMRALSEMMPLNPELEPRLKRALQLRNWLAHDYFWQRAGSILTDDGRERMIAELQETADFFGTLDAELTAMSDKWLDRVGISRQVIEREMQKYKRGQNA